MPWAQSTAKGYTRANQNYRLISLLGTRTELMDSLAHRGVEPLTWLILLSIHHWMPIMPRTLHTQAKNVHGARRKQRRETYREEGITQAVSSFHVLKHYFMCTCCPLLCRTWCTDCHSVSKIHTILFSMSNKLCRTFRCIIPTLFLSESAIVLSVLGDITETRVNYRFGTDKDIKVRSITNTTISLEKTLLHDVEWLFKHHERNN